MANANKTGNIVVTSLPDYVEENKISLISRSVLEGRSVSMFNLQTGVVGPTKLNLLDTNVVFQDGSACGFSAQGSATLSQRQLTPALLKVNMTFCDKNILGTWAQNQVKIAAGIKVLPFEQELTNHIIDSVKAKLENMLYQGNASSGAQFDGLIKLIKAAKTSSSNTAGVDYQRAEGEAVYTSLKKVYGLIPEKALKEDTVILVSPADFRQFIQELVAANLYHYEANDAAGEYALPGTNTKVVSVEGLIGTSNIIACRKSNVFYGTDMSGDEEKFDLWYSKDDGLFKLAIEFSAGVQVAYPDEIVIAENAPDEE